MNAISAHIEANCTDYDSCEGIDTDTIENYYIDWLTQDDSKPGGYRFTIDFWKDLGVVK